MQTPFISLDSQGAQIAYLCGRLCLPWQDYPEAFANFVRALTKDKDAEGKIFSRVEITRLRMTNACTGS